MFSLFKDTREVLNFLWISGTMNGYKRDVYLCMNARDVLSIYEWKCKRCLSMFECKRYFIYLWMDIYGMFIYVWMLKMFYLSMDGYIRDIYLCLNSSNVLSIYEWIYKGCLSMFEF